MSWSTGLEENTNTFEFVTTTDEIIRAVAGPGTGKSFAIKRRIARLLSEGFDPRKILAVTFTRTAAADLKREISDLNIAGSDLVIAKTLHSLSMQILLSEEVLNTFNRNPRIMLLHEIKTMLYDIDNPDFGQLKDRLKRIRAYEAAWARLQKNEPGYYSDTLDQEFEELIVEWMNYHQSMLIGEVIPLTLKYFQDNPYCSWKNRFEILLVDEYQDLNKAEQELIREIGKDSQIVIVGDDDQSIYSFKFAHPEGIREIPNVYPGCKLIDFNICRRCPKKVVKLADTLIHNNRDRTLGHLEAFTENDDGEVKIIQWETLEKEIYGIVEIVKTEIRNGILPKDILILTPRRLIGYEIRDILNSDNIDAKSYFREDALPNDKVKIAFSLLYYLVNSNDAVSLRFLLGCKSSSKLTNQYRKIVEYSKDNCLSVNEILTKLSRNEIIINGTSDIRKRFIDIEQEIERIKEYLSTDYEKVFEYFKENDDDSYYYYEIENIYQDIINSIDRPENVNDESFYIWFRDVIEKLSSQICMPEIPTDINHIRIMSLHSSKGLSSRIVIITTAVAQLLNYIPESIEDSERVKVVEEQRRLFYVAITRCKCDIGHYPGKLIISSCALISGKDALQIGIPSRVDQMRKVHATPFIREMGPEIPRTIRGESLINF